MIEVIRFIFSSSSLILLILFFIKFRRGRKKRTMIKAHIKLGVNCYGCKEHIDNTPYENMTNLNMSEEIDALFKKENFRLCKSCKRDDKISQITNNSIFSKLKIKKFFYSKKSDITTIIYFISYVLFLGLHIWLREETYIFFYLYNLCLLSYWFLLYKKLEWDYIDKDKEDEIR